MSAQLSVSNSLSDRVYDHVKGRILAGELAPGERINEVQLAEALDMSRGPVREGMQMLILEGLLERVPRRGVFVRKLGDRLLRELCEVREALEIHAVKLIFRRGVDEVEAELRDLLRLGRSRQGNSSYEPDLHQRLLALSGNETLMTVGESIHSQLKLKKLLSGADKSRAREAWSEHKAVLDAILERDESGAVQALQHHLASAVRRMLETNTQEAQREGSACYERE